MGNMMIGTLTVLSMALANGCDPRGAVDEPAERGAGVERHADPGAPTSDTTPLAPAAREDDAAVEEPTVVTERGSASPVELARLSAALDVPVQGVAREQLRDTYADARGERVHEALDIPAPRGTPVLSATDGRLLKLFDSRPGGLMVYATDPSERFILLYGHLDAYAAGLEDGMPLTRGQVIGYVGTTGNAPPDTPHLHFGILRGDPDVSWWEGDPVNPYPLLVRGRLPD